jgi:hypothetical protein
VVDLKGISPDDAFSAVPYEKGFTLLFHLEELVGGAGNSSILRICVSTVPVLILS